MMRKENTMSATTKTRIMADRRRIASALLALAGLIPYFVCFPWHTCIGGHLSHPPYSYWPYLNDGLWNLLLACSAVFAWKSSMYWKVVFSSSVGIMLLNNWFYIDGNYPFWRITQYALLPALLIIVIVALISLFKGENELKKPNKAWEATSGSAPSAPPEAPQG